MTNAVYMTSVCYVRSDRGHPEAVREPRGCDEPLPPPHRSDPVSSSLYICPASVTAAVTDHGQIKGLAPGGLSPTSNDGGMVGLSLPEGD
jgi:hypothetical protein